MIPPSQRCLSLCFLPITFIDCVGDPRRLSGPSVRVMVFGKPSVPKHPGSHEGFQTPDAGTCVCVQRHRTARTSFTTTFVGPSCLSPSWRGIIGLEGPKMLQSVSLDCHDDSDLDSPLQPPGTSHVGWGLRRASNPPTACPATEGRGHESHHPHPTSNHS